MQAHVVSHSQRNKSNAGGVDRQFHIVIGYVLEGVHHLYGYLSSLVYFFYTLHMPPV